MHRMHSPIPSKALLIVCTLWGVGFQAEAQSYNAICTLPDGSLLQVGEKDDVPIMAAFDTSWVVQPNPAGTPVKGEFRSVCADATGNLFVAYEDESNPKKTVEGFLRRVGGTWSALPPLPKGWSGMYDPVAAGPDQLWFHTWHTDERRSVVVHWNGTDYTALPLPEHMKELHALFLDTDGALLADGAPWDGTGVQRFANGSWQAMGGALDGLHVDHFVRLSDGTLVCNVRRGSYSSSTTALYRWNGQAWEPLPGARVKAKRDVEDLCAGPDGRLYVLIEAADEEDRPQRLACWHNGALRWYKGTEAAALQSGISGNLNLYQLACDRTGLLHARDYSKQRTYPAADFEWEADGYPTRDAEALKVLLHYQADEAAYAEKTDHMFKLFGKYFTGQVPEDQTQLNGYWTTVLDPWLRDAMGRLAALGLKPGTNRLYDSYGALLRATQESYHAMNDMAAEGRRTGGQSSPEMIDRAKNTGNANMAAMEHHTAVLQSYKERYAQ